MSSPAFTQQLERSVSYWQSKAEGINDANLHTALTDVGSLFKTIEYGNQVELTRESSATLMLTLHRFIAIKGYWHSWCNLLQTTLGYPLPNPLRINLLNELAFMKMLNGSPSEATTICENALALATKTQLHPLITLTQSRLCRIYLETSNHMVAYKLGKEVLPTHLENNIAKASLLNTIGMAAHRLGEYPSAIHHFQMAVPIWKAQDATIYLGRTLMNWGNTLFLMGNKNKGFIKYEAARQQFTLASSYGDIAELAMNAGIQHAQENDLEQAHLLFNNAVSIIQTHKCPLHKKGLIYMNVGAFYVLLENYDKGEAFLIEARKIWGLLEDNINYANTLLELGKVAEEKQPNQAIELWCKAKIILEQELQENIDVNGCLAELSYLLQK